jgi:cytochrome c-type biogenesis protein CcmE
VPSVRNISREKVHKFAIIVRVHDEREAEMAQLAWEKPSDTSEKVKNDAPKFKRRNQSERLKFLLGGALILGAVLYLVLTGTIAGARYFISVETLLSKADYVGETVRITGAVLGDSIVYDAATGDLAFTIVHVPDEFDDLATALNEAVNDPTRTKLHIRMTNQVMPDLLTNEAQAILTGELSEDGVFYGTELNLKCPSRFGENETDGIAAHDGLSQPGSSASDAKD